MDLKEILANGEGQIVEFKKSLSLKREAMEALCSMVNADTAQGVVFFGIDSDGTVCGVEPGNLDSAQRSLSQSKKNNIAPALQMEIFLEQFEGNHLLIISAKRNRAIPYHEFDGRAWIRQGSENRILSFFEKEQLRTSRERASHPGPWKCDHCGSLVGTLSSFSFSKEGIIKNYDCNCGGQFWPIT